MQQFIQRACFFHPRSVSSQVHYPDLFRRCLSGLRGWVRSMGLNSRRTERVHKDPMKRLLWRFFFSFRDRVCKKCVLDSSCVGPLITMLNWIGVRVKFVKGFWNENACIYRSRYHAWLSRWNLVKFLLLIVWGVSYCN